MEKPVVGRPFVVDWKHTEEELREAWEKVEKKNGKRFHALYLLRKKKSLKDVKDILGVHYVTIQRWVKLYREKGLEGMEKKKTGPPAGKTEKLSEEQKEEIVKRSDEGKIISAPKEAMELKKRHNIKISASGMRKLLHRLDLRPKMPRPKCSKRKEGALERWKEGGLTRALGEKGASPAAGATVVADEARVGLIGTVRRRWLKKGKVYEQEVQRSYKWAWLMIAVDIMTGAIWWVWQENMKKETVAKTLKELKSQGVGTIIWDGAAGHRSKLAKEAGPTLIFQPAYTPEANPAERFIQEIRREIEGFIYESLEDKKQATENFLRNLSNDPEKVKQICSWGWIVSSVDAAHSEIAA
jgi:transposase